MLLALILASTTLYIQPSEAAPKSIKDCEKIQAADAYNLCLASFGPVAHEHNLKPVPPGVGSGKMYGLRHRHHRYTARSGRHRHGRKSMEISVGSAQN